MVNSNTIFKYAVIFAVALMINVQTHILELERDQNEKSHYCPRKVVNVNNIVDQGAYWLDRL